MEEQQEKEWVTLADLSQRYGRSKTWVRDRLNKAESSVSPSERSLLVKNHRGTKGKEYAAPWAVSALGEKSSGVSVLNTIFGHTSRMDGVLRVHGKSRTGLSPLAGILESRLASKNHNSQAYDRLLQDAAQNGNDLLIRAITGQDLFNDYGPISTHLRERGKAGKTTKILLLYPFGHGAKVRIAAEDEKNARLSTFLLDAFRTFIFISDRLAAWGFDPKWADNLPHSFLVWTNSFALLEPYDHGRPDGSISGCIGRNAPVLVVNGNSEYHTLLRRGFKYVFQKPEEETGISVYSIEDVALKFKDIGLDSSGRS